MTTLMLDELPARAYPLALSRATRPYALAEAARFSEMPESYDPYFVLSVLKQFKRVYKPLKRALSIRYYQGPCRPRELGQYELLYIVFLTSGRVDVSNWFYAHQRDRRMWRECGFDPQGVSYATVQRRFVELEDYIPAFEAAVARLVRIARKYEPGIGAWLHVDSTEASTSAPLRHDCRHGENCGGRIRGSQVTIDTAGDLRREGVDKTIDEPAYDDAAETDPDLETDERTEYIETYTTPTGQTRQRRRVRRGGHWWSSPDLEAGTRSYGRRRVWDGYNVCQVVDHVTGLAILTRIFPADKNETSMYPELVTDTTRLVGRRPVVVAGDRAYDITSVYAFNAKHGIGSAFNQRTKQNPPVGIDENKVPTCKHCGGGCDYVGFIPVGDTHELRFRCSLPESDACRQIQSRSAARNPKYVTPLWTTNPIWVELTSTHQQFERYHFVARRRDQTGPKSSTVAPRRHGLAAQQLRATIGNLTHWLTICAKYAWTHKRNTTHGHAAGSATGRGVRPAGRRGGHYSIANLPIVDAIRVTNEGRWHERLRKRKAARRAAGLVGGGYRLRRE